MNLLAEVLIFSGLVCALAFCLWAGNGEGGRMTFTLSTFTERRGWLWLHGRDGLGRRRTFVVGAVQRRFWLIVFMERIDVTLVDDRLQSFPAPAGHPNEQSTRGPASPRGN